MSEPQSDTSPRPIVSVVIPTRNRCRLLREVIESIWAQTLGPSSFEIIVCDNLSTDATAEVMADLQKRSPCPLHYQRMPVNRGPAHSRNTGVQLARGEIIAFTDDDCRAHPEWLQRGLTPFADEKVAFVTGSVLDKPEQPVRFFCRQNSGVTSEHPSYPTCNAFYRRRVFLEMGSFDENLCFRDVFNRPSECSDTDLAWRIKKKGYANVFVREMIIYHEVDRLTILNWMRDPFRLFALPALVKRHPELRTILLHWKVFFSLINVLFYLLVIGLVLGAAVHWVFLLMALPFCLWASTAGGAQFSLARIPKIIPRVVLLGMRQAFICAGLIYGSVRFRCLVM